MEQDKLPYIYEWRGAQIDFTYEMLILDTMNKTNT
ncbi:unnamed protein product [Paramecium sonneborni]|uniref:Uncharacterized protein n=1 Tax=Paramecium sonneborni TaxID=65129 RepID=A0A8S1R2Q8_9CILI|nr:unnamed protein product [Paramecium sonneborni]